MFVLNHKVTHSSAIEVFDIAVTIIALGLQGKKQCFLRETKGAAVRQ